MPHRAGFGVIFGELEGRCLQRPGSRKQGAASSSPPRRCYKYFFNQPAVSSWTLWD
jgi:hypothetical protein